MVNATIYIIRQLFHSSNPAKEIGKALRLRMKGQQDHKRAEMELSKIKKPVYDKPI